MTKKEFLSALRRRLRGLSALELRERMDFYSEIIDDKIEEGLSECDAVADVGDVDDIAAQILAERTPNIQVKTRKNDVSAWQMALLIIGSPIWFSILIAVFAVMWSVVITIWAIEIPMFIFAMISKYLVIVCVAVSKAMAKFTQITFDTIANLFRR